MVFRGSHVSYRFFPVLIVALFLSILVFSHSPYGHLRMTYDSYDYMEGGKSAGTYLAEKNRDGFPYTVHAPLFYFYLGLFQNKMLACWWLNVISFITSLLLIFRIGRTLNLPDSLSYACMITTAMCYPWMQNHFFVWTEPLFSVFIFLLILFLLERKPLTVIINLCILLFLLRKAGVFLGIGTALYYLSTKDFRKFLMLGLILASVVTGWELFIIHKAKVPVSLNTLAHLGGLERIHYADALTSWIVPRFVPLYWRIVIAVTGIVIIVILYKKEVWVLFRERKTHVLFSLFSGYLLCIVLLTGAPEYMEAERLLSVMLPLLVLILFSLLNEVSNSGNEKRKLFYSVVSLWGLYLCMRSVSHFL